ncbi:MAG: RND transporter, partial [Cytophagales bacterium]|nr:RND transporter [Rhizobacter sp.]
MPSTAGIASSAKTLAPAAVGVSDAQADPIAADWWQGFGDATLSGLVNRALDGSPSLKAAQARLARSQAAVDTLHAAQGVQVNGSFDSTRQRFTANGMIPPPLAGTMRDTATL